MALLGDIRKKSWLLIVVIGVPLVAFLVGDIFSRGNPFGSKNELGSVNGTPITLQDYNVAYNRLSQNPQLQNAEQNMISQFAWNNLVADALVSQTAEKLGLAFTEQQYYEAAAMFLSSINPNLIDASGNVNTEATKQLLAQIKQAAQQGNQQAQAIYQQWENANPQAAMLRADFLSLVSSGILGTSSEANFTHQENTETADITYHYIDYATFNAKNNIKVTDKDIIAYIKKYKKQFKPQATANLAYAYFPAKASDKDIADILKELNSYLAPQIIKNETTGATDTIASFANAKNASEFVAKYSQDNYDPNYYTKQQIENLRDPHLKNVLANLEVGKVYGPIKTENVYELIKVNDAKLITDSAKTSHILISYAGAQGSESSRTPQAAKKMADSILAVVKANPAQFNELASKISDDKVAAKEAGSIGWISRFQQGFDPTYIEFSTTHPKGTIDMINTPFGFHIVRVDDVKSKMGYQFAIIKKNLEASDDTQDELFKKANELAVNMQGKSANDFINAARKAGAEVNSANGVTRFEGNIVGLTETRKISDVLAWAFDKESKPGMIQKIETSNGGQIVVFLTDKFSKEEPNATAFKGELEPLLSAELAYKKAQELVGNNHDFESIGKVLGGKTENATGITFTQANLNGIGVEPTIGAAAFALPKGGSSNIIKGANGLFVIKVNNKTENNTQNQTSQDMIQAQYRNVIQSSLISSMVDNANVKDKRAERITQQR